MEHPGTGFRVNVTPPATVIFALPIKAGTLPKLFEEELELNGAPSHSLLRKFPTESVATIDPVPEHKVHQLPATTLNERRMLDVVSVSVPIGPLVAPLSVKV